MKYMRDQNVVQLVLFLRLFRPSVAVEDEPTPNPGAFQKVYSEYIETTYELFRA